MQTTAADALVGRTLEGRYRILERIARGGMSTVYAAVDERLDRQVAVKVMSPALTADPAFSDRFAREARAAARLAHLNAVSVYDQGVDASGGELHVFLVMELVAGRTLRELLRERGRLDPAAAISIMEPVLAALAAAHRAGLVHRDVKPENILLSDEGVVKVADFGLARAVEADAAATRTGLMMGTVAYCAPEQVSRGHADQRSDVYSAGIVLFELLTGGPPYRGESAMNIAYQHVHSRVPAPSSRIKPAGEIPYEIDELVVNATDSDPAGRPADAGAFLAEVADARQALGLPVVPVPPRARPRHHARVDSAAAGTTEVLHGPAGDQDTLTTAPGTGALSLLAADPPRGAQPGPPPVVLPPVQLPPDGAGRNSRRRRRRRGLLVLLVVLLLGLGAGYGGWWLVAGRYARVPGVAGLVLADARAALQRAHFKPGSVSMQFSETVRSGTVIGTDPGGGDRAVRGHTVSLVVSKGKERFTVPKVAGDSEAKARSKLSAIPVQVPSQAVTRPSDTVDKGIVLGTDPPAGTKVKRDQAVTLIVSSGLPIVDIPVIAANTSFDDAKAMLTAEHFKVVRKDQYSTTVPKGVVISSDPTGSVPKFSTITVVVSKGPQMVQVPDIRPFRTSVHDAEQALHDVGLQVRIRPLGQGEGTVVLQVSPASGTVVQVGSTVTLTTF